MKIDNTKGILLVSDVSDSDVNGIEQRLRKAVRVAMMKSTTLVELDLSMVERIDDRGLQSLIKLHADVNYTKEGATVRIINITKDMQDWLSVNSIDELFELVTKQEMPAPAPSA